MNSEKWAGVVYGWPLSSNPLCLFMFSFVIYRICKQVSPISGPFDHRHELTARYLTTEGVETFDRRGACDILHTPFIILCMYY